MTWIRLGGNIYTAYNSSHFIIYLPKLIKVGRNLTSSDRNINAQFFRHGIRVIRW